MAGQWESLVQPQNAVDKGRCVYYPWSWVPAGMDDRRIMSWPGRHVPPLQSQTSGQVVNVAFLRHLLSGGYLPVISPVSRDESGAMGSALNVNGDDAAAAIAIAMGAAELLLVADVEGVMRDGVVIPSLTPDGARELMANGTAAGGMRAKLDAGLTAIAGGVARVRISDIAAITDSTRGTVLQAIGELS